VTGHNAGNAGNEREPFTLSVRSRSLPLTYGGSDLYSYVRERKAIVGGGVVDTAGVPGVEALTALST
jgi:hypothetical protein